MDHIWVSLTAARQNIDQKLNLVLSLSDSSKMESNDFIIFKHGCGNDSTYHKERTWTRSTSYPLIPSNWHTVFSDKTKAKMAKPCDNFTFHHVEVEYVGDDSYTYKYEESDGKNVTEEDPEDGSNPIILKIRLLNISDESSKQG